MEFKNLKNLYKSRKLCLDGPDLVRNIILLSFSVVEIIFTELVSEPLPSLCMNV